MTSRLTIQNWDVEPEQSDAGPENKLNPIKDLETEINKFFEICQWDENGKFIDIYADSDAIIIDATPANTKATQEAKVEESQSQEVQTPSEPKLSGLSSLNLNSTTKQIGEYNIIQTLSKNASYKVKLVQDAQGK